MTEPHRVVPQEDGVADHAAKQPLLKRSPELRTFVQGVATDVGVAVAFLVYDTLQSDEVDWKWLGLSAVKTALMTAASYVMKKKNPPVPSS